MNVKNAGNASTRRRVLVVDDISDLATTLAALIELLGHEVRSTTFPREVLPIVESFAPEIVILDISMPQMTGWELAQQIRAHSLGKLVCLVALTGLGEPDDYARSTRCGFDEHWIKPVDIAALEKLLASACKTQGSDSTPS